MNAQVSTQEVVDGRRKWALYLDRIRIVSASQDRVARDMTQSRLMEVATVLAQVGGLVTKRDLTSKATNSDLWKAVDEYVECWLKRRGIRSPLGLPERAYNMYPDYARPYDDRGTRFVNPKYRIFDVHHIWPETLGGPTKGWNLLPLPKHQHLFYLHPVINELVRESRPGTKIRLL